MHFAADKNDDHLLIAVSGPATSASLSILNFLIHPAFIRGIPLIAGYG